MLAALALVCLDWVHLRSHHWGVKKMSFARCVIADFFLSLTRFRFFAADSSSDKSNSVGLSFEPPEEIRKGLEAKADTKEIPGIVALIAYHEKSRTFEANCAQYPTTKQPMSRGSTVRIYLDCQPHRHRRGNDVGRVAARLVGDDAFPQVPRGTRISAQSPRNRCVLPHCPQRIRWCRSR
jgi:hypothetical protein